ncbi:L-aspartate oxidase [Halomonas halocynthiae]|uniref:L-aspartate oxidase n=1 Tax=Halomonas halocynthiae TaxID=176290 RepID=UPI000410C9AE|nr:L-aspartate oxidase [Halomonas halocynthiae]
MTHPQHEVLIIGGGVAGLSLALQVADHRAVTVLQPESSTRGASSWAQGGIAATLSPADCVEDHVSDTLTAGDGLCYQPAVRFTVEHGPQAIEWLLSLGVPFTRDTNSSASYPYHLTQEGGHGRRRIIHADDATGRAVTDTLMQHTLAHPGITLRHDLTVIELLNDANGQCRGALCLDGLGQTHQLLATDTILATGGASGLYKHTTSPHPATGDGMIMAAELGAELMNLEFQQFHPTCFYDPDGPPFLISEAVRGEGGKLIGTDGKRFMPAVDSRAELAPRDIVARAIDAEMQRTKSDYVLLDVRHLGSKAIQQHFPTIYAHCLTRDLDITHSPIPVVPAAHYSCGGIYTDLAGATNVTGLSAIGEVACTGLHGANRMASNSLLECLVFATSCAARLVKHPTQASSAAINERPVATSKLPPQQIASQHQQVKDIMSRQVAIVRSNTGLREAEHALDTLMAEIHRNTDTGTLSSTVSLKLVRLTQAIRLAQLSVACASARQESRGLHYSPDTPERHAEFAKPSRIRLNTTGSPTSNALKPVLKEY